MSSEKTSAIVVNKYALGPLFTNCYLVYGKTERKGVLIDPGAFSGRIKKHIEKEKIDIVASINTHGHADHIMGDGPFGYPVYIHRLDALCLGDPSRNLAYLAEIGFETGVKAARLLEDGDVIGVGEIELAVIHTPGHTPGSISLKCGDVLVTGDLLFLEGVGRTDLPGGDNAALSRSLREKIMALPDSIKVYPGHGPETTIEHERRYNHYLS